MKKTLLKTVFFVMGVLLIGGTSSCTSKSENASTQNALSSQQNEADIIDEDPLTNLIKGNERFVSGKLVHIHQDSLRVKELTEGQHPRVVVICCSDSRVTPEIVFDQGLGDIFTIRTAGNVMSDYEEGSIEYAVEHTGAKLVVVLGHTSCGAIKAMLDTKEGETVPGHIASIVDALKAETEEKEALEKGGEALPYNAVKANVEHGVKQLCSSKPILSEMHEEGKIKIVGAIYHIEDGKVEFLDI